MKLITLREKFSQSSKKVGDFFSSAMKNFALKSLMNLPLGKNITAFLDIRGSPKIRQ